MKKQITIKFWAGTPEAKNALNNTRKELAAQGYKEVTTDRTPANSDTVTIYGNRWGGEWSGRIRFILERWYKPTQTQGPTDYQRRKAAARDRAILWQEKASKKALSYSDLNRAGAYFYKVGKKYGLLREFKDNAIL